MIELTQIFAALSIVAGSMIMITVWAPRRVWAKLWALGTSIIFLPIAYAGFLQLLSIPKPVGLEWWHANAAEATVLGSSLREGDGIYLWLQLREAREPRAYVLPWDRDLAEQLQAAQREAVENQTALQMRLPFEASLEAHEPRFYALPQPARPPKEPDRTGPRLYEHARAREA